MMQRPFRNRLFFLLLLLAASASSTPDLVVRGRVAGQQAGSQPQPLAFANIGIRGRNVGTTADEAGRFQLSIPAALSRDSVTFSALGYYARTVAVATLAAHPDTLLVLPARPQALPDVSVKAAGQPRTQVLGKTRGSSVSGFVVGKGGGAEIARLMQPRRFPVFLDQTQVYITRNQAPSFRLRLRLYARDPATGRPGADLLHESILIDSSLRQGWLTTDLRSYNLQLTEPFFVAYEWLEADVNNPRIAIQGVRGDEAVFARAVSQGQWGPAHDFNWVINAHVTSYGPAQ